MGKLRSVKPEAPAPAAAELVDEAGDRVECALTVAYAISDALRVLSALERTTGHNEPDGMATGDSMAGGYAVVDNTMPDLASHLCVLIDEIRDDVKVLSAPDSA